MQRKRRIVLAVTPQKVAFPDNLRRTRLAHFLTQAELARRPGVHALTITRHDSPGTAPSTRTVGAVARALGLGPGDLAGRGEVAEADHRSGRRSTRQSAE